MGFDDTDNGEVVKRSDPSNVILSLVFYCDDIEDGLLQGKMR